MVVHDTIEFVISKRAVNTVYDTLEKRVNYLFDVFLSRASDEFDGVHDQLRLKLEGKSECRERAKEYIIAVCLPETKKEVVFQNGIKKDQLRKKIEEVEQLYCASLTLNIKERKIDIRGSRIAVALAASSLEETICIFEDNISSVPDAVVKSGDQTNSCDNSTTSGRNSSVCERPEIPSNLVNTSSGQERTPTEGRLLECADTSSKSMREDVIHRERAEESLNDAKSEPDESSESVNDCSPASFALKLGYSETDIDCALGKLGHMADKNSLLDELLKRNASVKQLEDGSCCTVEKIIPPVEDADCLRSISIDGSNVAMSHGNQRVFSCRGIGIAVDWFLHRGHKDIKVFVPLWRKESPRPDKPITDQEILNRLEQDRFLVWTPSRKIQGRRITCYDDRFIIQTAVDTDGVIVSNDTFRDLLNKSPEWKRCIEQRLLMYSFVNDTFMPPDDPLGRHGPVLDEFLRKGCGKLCPYGQRCTYGNRCKFLHPERVSKSEDQKLGAMATQRTEQSLQVAPEVPYGNVQRPPRPLPPPPDMPQYLLSKPLPLPPHWEIRQRMTTMFPPTLRSSPMGSERPISDPLPYSQELPLEVRQMHENFQRTSSMPCFESTQPCSPVPVAADAVSPRPAMGLEQRGSVSQIPEGYVTAHSSHSTIQAYNTSPPRPDIVARGMPPIQRVVPSNARPPTDGWLPGDAFGTPRYQQYPPHYRPNYPPIPAQQPHSVPNNHWGATPYSQQQYQQHPAPPHYQYSAAYFPGNRRVPYRGQSNGYFRPRAPPIIGCGDDEADFPGEDASETELRIRAYEKLLEIFPDDGEKILKVMDDHPEVTSIEELTTYVVEEDSA